MSDTRGAFLSCPACAGPLAPWRDDGDSSAGAAGQGAQGDGSDIALWSCSSCGGVWLDWFGEEPTRVARRLAGRFQDGVGGRAGGSCPRDGTTLVARPYLDSGPLVERCPTCLGLFARRGQLGALAAFHEKLPLDAPEPIVWVSWLTRFWHAFVK